MLENIDFVLKTFEQATEYSFLELFTASDGKLLRCTVSTYKPDGTVIKIFQVVFKDTKKRQAKTLERAGVTAEQLCNGMDEQQGVLLISEYFIDHEDVILGHGIASKTRMLNERIAKYRYKTISNPLFDLDKMAKRCEVSAKDKEWEILQSCLSQYRRLKRMEENKFECLINFAYYRMTEYGRPKELIYCDTTMGRIIYDISSDTWSMTQKEMQDKGRRIENFDIDNIKYQLRSKYKVRNMSELFRKLKRKRGEQ